MWLTHKDNLGQNWLYFDPCDLEIWPSKSIGIFIEPWLILRCDINCLQLKLWPVAHPQAKIYVKIGYVLYHVTLKFHIQNQYSSLLLHDWSLGTIQNACGENSALWLVHKANLGRNCPCFDPCDLEIWSLTFKINRVLHQHMLKPHVQYTFPTAKTLNCSSLTRPKFTMFWPRWPQNLTFDLQKQ